jgi:hypothetical protein
MLLNCNAVDDRDDVSLSVLLQQMADCIDVLALKRLVVAAEAWSCSITQCRATDCGIRSKSNR